MFKVNNEKHDALVFFFANLLTWNTFHIFFSISIVDFGRVNISWVATEMLSWKMSMFCLLGYNSVPTNRHLLVRSQKWNRENNE